MIAEVILAVTIILAVSNIFDLGWIETPKKIDDILWEVLYMDLDPKLHHIQRSVNRQIGRPTSIPPEQFQRKVP